MASLNNELVLVLLQFLGEEALEGTMHKLEQESGLFFNLKYFEEKILAGDWDECEKYLNGFINIRESRCSRKVFFEIRKQKYFEALDKQDKATAVEILMKDLKIFSIYNEDLYNELAQLITLDNFRENEELSHYGDVKQTRIVMMGELKKLIGINPSLNNKLIFPSFKSSRLRHLINQSLNWQHELCGKPNTIPDIETLFTDHACSPPRKRLCMPSNFPSANFPPAPAAPSTNVVASHMVNGNPSSSSQSLAAFAASSLPGSSNQDYQSNDRDEQIRRLLSEQSLGKVVKVSSAITPQPSHPLFDELPRTVVCKLHQGSTVTSMEFHPSIHSILAVGCENGEISLWEARLRERLISKSFQIWNLSNFSVEFQAANSKELSVKRVTWSPDASFIGVAFEKHLIQLYSYQVPNGLQQHLEINAHDGGINDLAFSFPKNNLSFVTCGDDKLIKVWDLNGEKMFTFEGHVAPVNQVLPHSKGNFQFLFSTSVDGKSRIWLYENDGFQLEYDTPGKCSTTMVFIDDGTRLFSCGTNEEGDCYLVEWNEDNGVVKKTYSGFRNRYGGMVQIDTAKNRFFAVGVDNQIKFWDVDTIDVLTSTDADGGLPSLPRLTFNKNGNLLAVSTEDGGFKFLANTDGIKFLSGNETTVAPIDAKIGAIAAMASSSKQNNRNSDDSNSNDVKEIVLPVECREVTMPESLGSHNKATRLIYTYNGNGLLALGSKGILKMWKWSPTELNPTGQVTARVAPQYSTPNSGIFFTKDLQNNYDSAIPCLDISKNDSYTMAACGDSISLFNMVNFDVLIKFMEPPPAVTFLVFSPVDNNIIAVGYENGEIHIFNARKQELIKKLKGHKKYITGIIFSTRLNTMITSDANAQIFSWCMKTWRYKKSVSVQMPGETLVQFHIDLVKFLACHYTQIAIYDASRMELIRQWLPPRGWSGSITSASYSCYSQQIYATFTDGNIGIFDAESFVLKCRIDPSAYLHQTLSNSQNVYPLVVIAHPQEYHQFAIGLSDGSVKVIEPADSAGWWVKK